MRSTGVGFLVLCAVAVAAGCRSRSGNEAAGVRPRVMLSFSGMVDASSGAASLWAVPPGGADGRPALLQEIPVGQDGNPGTGPADTVELVTEAVRTVPGGCDPLACEPVDSFEGDVRIRSFFAGAVLTHLYAEITDITPAGREACNSSAPYESLSNALGLWDYGSLGRAGTASDSALRTWRFRLPDSSRFVFHGHIVADLVTADASSPTTVAIPGSGSIPAGASVQLSCSDAETGCAATYYTVDGTEPTTGSQRYAGPIPVPSGLTLRWFSVDYWGNAEVARSARYTLD